MDSRVSRVQKAFLLSHLVIFCLFIPIVNLPYQRIHIKNLTQYLPSSTVNKNGWKLLPSSLLLTTEVGLFYLLVVCQLLIIFNIIITKDIFLKNSL